MQGAAVGIEDDRASLSASRTGPASVAGPASGADASGAAAVLAALSRRSGLELFGVSSFVVQQTLQKRWKRAQRQRRKMGKTKSRQSGLSKTGAGEAEVAGDGAGTGAGAGVGDGGGLAGTPDPISVIAGARRVRELKAAPSVGGATGEGLEGGGSTPGRGSPSLQSLSSSLPPRSPPAVPPTRRGGAGPGIDPDALLSPSGGVALMSASADMGQAGPRGARGRRTAGQPLTVSDLHGAGPQETRPRARSLSPKNQKEGSPMASPGAVRRGQMTPEGANRRELASATDTDRKEPQLPSPLQATALRSPGSTEGPGMDPASGADEAADTPEQADGKASLPESGAEDSGPPALPESEFEGTATSASELESDARTSHSSRRTLPPSLPASGTEGSFSESTIGGAGGKRSGSAASAADSDTSRTSPDHPGQSRTQADRELLLRQRLPSPPVHQRGGLSTRATPARPGNKEDPPLPESEYSGMSSSDLSDAGNSSSSAAGRGRVSGASFPYPKPRATNLAGSRVESPARDGGALRQRIQELEDDLATARGKLSAAEARVQAAEGERDAAVKRESAAIARLSESESTAKQAEAARRALHKELSASRSEHAAHADELEAKLRSQDRQMAALRRQLGAAVAAVQGEDSVPSELLRGPDENEDEDEGKGSGRGQGAVASPQPASPGSASADGEWRDTLKVDVGGVVAAAVAKADSQRDELRRQLTEAQRQAREARREAKDAAAREEEQREAVLEEERNLRAQLEQLRTQIRTQAKGREETEARAEQAVVALAEL